MARAFSRGINAPPSGKARNCEDKSRLPRGNDRKKGKSCKDKCNSKSKGSSFALLRMTKLVSALGVTGLVLIAGFGDDLDAVLGAEGDFGLQGYGVIFDYFEAPALG